MLSQDFKRGDYFWRCVFLLTFKKAHRLNLISRQARQQRGWQHWSRGGGRGTDIAEPEPGDKHKGRARREEIVVSWPSVPFKEWAADRRRDRCCCLPAHAVSILSERCGIHSRPDSFLSLLGQEEGAACLSAVSTVSCCIWRGSPLEVDIVVPQE